MLFDIRDEQRAAETLERFTGVNKNIWLIEKYKNARRIDYSNANEDIENLILENEGYFPNLKDIEMVVTHITTSSKKCIAIIDNGLLDLVGSYNLLESEIREFLDENDIQIDTDSAMLYYKGQCINISYGKCPIDTESKSYAAWSVGRKFYYDFTVCGFLSISDRDVYGGYVHKRPEILANIDFLLGTKLQHKWILNHKPYEIVFVIPEVHTVYNGWDDESDYEKVMSYLIMAYECICLGPHTIEILCKNNIKVHPSQILECNEFSKWE